MFVICEVVNDDDNYGSLLTQIIMEQLPHQFKLIISRKVGDETSDLTELLCLIRDNLKARENCLTPDNSFTRNLRVITVVRHLILHMQVQVYMFLNKLQK